MTALTRLPDWRIRMEDAIADIKSKPFDWKSHDCVIGLAGRIVLEITGVDLTAQYAGTFENAASAARLVRELGFSSVGDLVASRLPEIHPSHAVMGDIAAIAMDGPFGHALGVVNGERVFVLGEHGFGTVDLLDVQRAFKVG